MPGLRSERVAQRPCPLNRRVCPIDQSLPDGADANPFAAMVEHSYDLITVTGPDRALRYASPAFTRIFGVR